MGKKPFPDDWKYKNYSFFSHAACEYFPCHGGIDRERFNCLFCYCPLYAFGDKCGGNFTFTDKGIKNCCNCNIPHEKDNYGRIIEKFMELSGAQADFCADK